MPIILKVAPYSKGRFRFRFGIRDARVLFNGYHQVNIQIGGIETQSNINLNFRTTCPELYSVEINNWIIENEYCCYPPRNPTKLLFEVNNNQIRFIRTVN